MDNGGKIKIDDLHTELQDTINNKAQQINCTQSGAASNAIGYGSQALTDYSYAEGQLNLACFGNTYKIISCNNIDKTMVLDKVSGLNIGDLLQIKVYGMLGGILDAPITAIDTTTNKITVDTTQSLTRYCKYIIVKRVGQCTTHAEGGNTVAGGAYSHAEGGSTAAGGDYSHAEGCGTFSSGSFSHAEGEITVSSGFSSHAEGNSTIASGNTSHAEGINTIASGDYAHAEGNSVLSCYGVLCKITACNDTNKTITVDTTFGLTIGSLLQIKVYGSSSLLSNIPVTAINGNVITLATTQTITAYWMYALSKNSYSSPTHAEGNNTIASGDSSHAEGYNTIANGNCSHAEGTGNTASGIYSHAEGNGTISSNTSSHAEGTKTTANGTYSHAEGSFTTASGSYSHAQNYGTIAQGLSQTVIGQYNVAQGTANAKSPSDGVFIIGNGTDDNNRSNALSVTWNGDVYAKGKFYSNGISIGGNPVFTVITSGYDIVEGDNLFCDTSTGSYTVNLPATPNNNACVRLVDAKSTFSSMNLIVNGNGKKVMGDNTLVLNVKNASIMLIYNSILDDWRAI